MDNGVGIAGGVIRGVKGNAKNILKILTLPKNDVILIRSCSGLFALPLWQSPNSFLGHLNFSKFCFLPFIVYSCFFPAQNPCYTQSHLFLTKPTLCLFWKTSSPCPPNKALPILLPSFPNHYTLNFLRKRPLVILSRTPSLHPGEGSTDMCWLIRSLHPTVSFFSS